MVASRLQSVLKGPRGAERLWNLPPSFLAPSLQSPFSTSAPLAKKMKTMKQLRRMKKNRNRDIYAIKHSEARKAANLARQSHLQIERKAAMGDPIHGIETPFVKSFDTATPQDHQGSESATGLAVSPVTKTPEQPSPIPPDASKQQHFTHGLTPLLLQRSLTYSQNLLYPIPSFRNTGNAYTDAKDSEADAKNLVKERAAFEVRHEAATEAVKRIISISNANSVQRTKHNIERIIHTFGRHNTDTYLRPKNPPSPPSTTSLQGTPSPISPSSTAHTTLHPSLTTPGPPAGPTACPRAGPDTGSSEVQIGILTAKIRNLAQCYEGWGRQDKLNKRNLTLLLHRRQKLLRYMERKERGSERWENMLKQLGITEGCWRGQLEVR